MLRLKILGKAFAAPNSAGTTPLRSFSSSHRTLRLGNIASIAGISPVSLLSSSLICSMLATRGQTSVGTEPESSLCDRSSSSSRGKHSPIHLGTGPVSLPPSMSSSRRCVNGHSTSRMESRVPSMARSERCTLVTRPYLRREPLRSATPAARTAARYSRSGTTLHAT